MFYDGKVKSFLADGNRKNRIIRLLKKPIMELKRIRLKNLVISSEYKYGLNKSKRNIRIIVSLTSYPARFNVVTMTLKSILLQTIKPDRIILWHDCDESLITNEMHELEKYGIEYRHVEYNLKPHLKYYYAMKEYMDDIVITVDDDVIYPLKMIEELMETHRMYPKCVCARRVHRILYDDNGNALPYNNWIHEEINELNPSQDLLATGVGGVLYPPNCLNSMAFNIQDIIDYALNADDIWLYAMERLNSTTVAYSKNDMPMPPSLSSSQKSNLFMDNVVKGGNDKIINNVKELLIKEKGFKVF